MDVQISDPLGHREMGFVPAKGVSNINSGFSLQHNFGCDHADAGMSHSPAAKMGDNKK